MTLVSAMLALCVPSSAPRAQVGDDVRTAVAVGRVLVEMLGDDVSHVTVRAHGGVVTLFGQVADERTRDRAEKAAYSVAAVERVENQLRIVTPPANPRRM